MKLRAQDVRTLAVSILNDVDTRRRTLDALMAAIDQKERLDQRDRAFLNTLVYGVLRWRGRLDWIIQHFSKIKLAKIDPQVLNMLRLGLFQVVYLDRIPVSAAVNTTVEMSKQVAAPWVVKFVNAVMRKMASRHKTALSPRSTDSPVTCLSAEKSLPQWLAARWINRLGAEGAGAMCDAINAIPPTTVRTNTLKTNKASLKRQLSKTTHRIWDTAHAPEGLSFTGSSMPIDQIPAFLGGAFQVQDEAAQLTSHILSPKPGENVLDACAGLGGKTGHMAQLMENKGQIIAMDVNNEKLTRLKKEMKRLGVSNVTSVTADLNKPVDQINPDSFDRILLDAPCSGLGVIRRNPDTKWTVTEKDLVRYRNRQLVFLHHLSPMLKPGGTLAYVVCSTEPEENEMVVNEFLSAHKNFKPTPVKNIFGMDHTFFTGQGCFCSSQHQDQMDGFFCALFKRYQ